MFKCKLIYNHLKPYLRPQASMTRAEKFELYDTQYHGRDEYGNEYDDNTLSTYEYYALDSR